MTEFTPFSALFGGSLIGLGASVMLLANGKIAGISGIFAGLLEPKQGDVAWRIVFLAGLFASGAVAFLFQPELVSTPSPRPTWLLIGSGTIVGFGVRLGRGCTSGHGVCGISRLSRRSIIATCTFMFAGVIAAYVTRITLG